MSSSWQTLLPKEIDRSGEPTWLSSWREKKVHPVGRVQKRRVEEIPDERVQAKRIVRIWLPGRRIAGPRLNEAPVCDRLRGVERIVSDAWRYPWPRRIAPGRRIAWDREPG